MTTCKDIMKRIQKYDGIHLFLVLDKNGKKLNDDLEEETHENKTIVSNSPFVLCRLSLLSNGKNIYAIPNDMPLKVGDRVSVLLHDNTTEEAIIIAVEQHTTLSTPLNFEKAKILRKI